MSPPVVLVDTCPALSLPRDITWSGKGRTLLQLAPRLRASRVPPSLCVGWQTWREHRSATIARIARHFGRGALAIRSSSAAEDLASASQAGRYTSRLGVCAGDASALGAAIDAVFGSYDSRSTNDEVLIQPLVTSRLAAVVASHAIEDGASYYVFSLVEGPRTDSVTRGDVPVRTVYLAREAPTADDPDIARLHAAIGELERLCPAGPIEAEMVIDGDAVVLLQVRPVIAPPLPDPTAARRRRRQLNLARKSLCEPDPHCLGERRVLALMPDWNPAELLGAHPRPLALGLFGELIGRSAWRSARAAFGYRMLADTPLLLPFGGRPYVDVRASANSLLPASIDTVTAAALVDAWQERLLRRPELHDKYEFTVAQTCVDFQFDADHAIRYAGLLGRERLARYRAALATVSARCVDATALQHSDHRFAQLRRAVSAPEMHPLALIRAATALGALPFASVARQAFVFEALMRSAVARGALSESRLLMLQQSCATATRDFLTAGRDEQMAQFGFLRAGTFEITTPPLAELGVEAPAAGLHQAPPFELTGNEAGALQKLLREAGYHLSAGELIKRYQQARQGRERGKYALSHAVSVLLEAIVRAGARIGLDRESLSWLTPHAFAHALAGVDCTAQITHAREQHRVDALLRLPPVLDPTRSLDSVTVDAGAPSFVGNGRGTGRVVRVAASASPASIPSRAVLAIESADPGFDWIFSRAPAALITAFGGPNSHMAIRCAELGVPAVLGLGLERWRRLATTRHLCVDAATQSLTPLHHCR
ncbi:PEP-utilizing enzyme [Tahibacter amnicola]|uniref:PEP-utilizing enzyme n=1 Tax=Tahibacter amnicola TaxID=2976241 RepID=A0ABY6BJ04_9GAMM|nr:PEP-utilizing enzyme [Tahibacter amnicola]UXI67827.1 PEP-utilizing enzyme [Tahibacter amnicola]